MKLDKPILGGVIVTVLGLATSRAEAYRTASDMSEFAGASKVAWQSDQVSLQVSDFSRGPLATTGVDAVLEQSLTAWNAVQCAQPSFSVSGHTYAPASPGDGLNTVQWVTANWASYGFAPDAAAMTDVQYQQLPTGGWAIVEADLYLNSDRYSWAYGPSEVESTQDLAGVLLHESGHIVGLLHPCEVVVGSEAPLCTADPAFERSVLFPIYRRGTKELSADDIAGTCYLYPSAHCAAEGCPEGTLCALGGCVPSCGGLRCSSNEICVDEACVAAARTDAGACGDRDASTCAPPEVTQGNGQLWDPCAVTSECASGTACTANGFCSVHCSSVVACSGSNACADDGLCSPSGGVFADPCTKPGDCSSAICVKPDGRQGSCTRACDLNTSDCPIGHTCQNLDGQGPVCAPLVDNSGGGCRIGSASQSDSSEKYWLLLAGVAVGWWRRRRAN